jgi:hypothetical protein
MARPAAKWICSCRSTLGQLAGFPPPGHQSPWIPQPTERHADLLNELLALPGVQANLMPDAHLAALALEHGLTLYSTDGDFARFPALRWINPLAL